MKKYLNSILFLLFATVNVGCTTEPCHIEERPVVPMTNSSEKTMSSPKDLTKRVRIYKADGSLQCGLGKKVDLGLMAKELVDIQVFSSENKSDGLMRIQLCGHPAGTCNVYEILEEDLIKAQGLGFKKWIRD